jgi:hypothetical protein
MTGGAMPHVLELGETILFFNTLRVVYQNDTKFYRFIRQLKARAVYQAGMANLGAKVTRV